MKCPNCEGGFQEFELKDSGVIVDVCQSCHAIWFDKNEFWATLKDKKAKILFLKQGLLNKVKTKYKCLKCRSCNTFLERGTLPMADVEVHRCNFCNSFLLFDQKSKKQESKVQKKNLNEIKESNFSMRLFEKRLNDLNSEVYELTDTMERPKMMGSLWGFLSKFEKSFSLIFKEPEILLFSLLQVLAISVAYVIWIQMVDWLPAEFWERPNNSDEARPGDIVLMIWGIFCIGLATLPIGFFTACTGVVHILSRQGRDSTVWRCCRFVYPKIWQLWIFSWIDGCVTVHRIVDRLPQKNKPARTAAERAFDEAMYYAWKVGTAGVIPALLTTNNTWRACKNSIEFLKHKALDIMILRVGYSAICWVVGVLTYLLAAYVLFRWGPAQDKMQLNMYDVLFLLGAPMLVGILVVKMLVSPIYILSLFSLYFDYMDETDQKMAAPQKNVLAQTAIWFFTLMIIVAILVILFQKELGIAEMLA